MTNDLVCGFFSISETVLSGSHIASSSARVSACLELPQQLRQLGDIRRDPPRLHCAGNAFSSPGKTAKTKPSARLDPLRTSSELDRCSRSFFAALGLCTRHKKVPPLHPASTYPQDHPRPGPVRGS